MGATIVPGEASEPTWRAEHASQLVRVCREQPPAIYRKSFNDNNLR